MLECEEIQLRMAAYQGGDVSTLERQRIDLHLDRCQECQEHQEFFHSLEGVSSITHRSLSREQKLESFLAIRDAIQEKEAQQEEAEAAKVQSIWAPLVHNRVWVSAAALVLAFVLGVGLLRDTPAPQELPLVSGPFASNVPGVRAHGFSVTRLKESYQGRKGNIQFAAGTLVVDYKRPEADAPLIVETPRLRVLVKGTRFLVRDTKDELSVAVERGVVEVQYGSESRLIRANESWTRQPEKTSKEGPANVRTMKPADAEAEGRSELEETPVAALDDATEDVFRAAAPSLVRETGAVAQARDKTRAESETETETGTGTGTGTEAEAEAGTEAEAESEFQRAPPAGAAPRASLKGRSPTAKVSAPPTNSEKAALPSLPVHDPTTRIRDAEARFRKDPELGRAAFERLTTNLGPSDREKALYRLAKLERASGRPSRAAKILVGLAQRSNSASAALAALEAARLFAGPLENETRALELLAKLVDSSAERWIIEEAGLERCALKSRRMREAGRGCYRAWLGIYSDSPRAAEVAEKLSRIEGAPE